MKNLEPPFLELSFYFANEAEQISLERLITTLLGLGATLTGDGKAHKRLKSVNTHFASITQELLEPVAIESLIALLEWFTSLDTRIVQVHLVGATRATQDTAEIVTYQSISPQAAAVDHHPVAIWTNGDIFSGSLRTKRTKQNHKIGRQIYQRFCELVDLLRPSYAAITSEYGLECPTDLQLDSRSYAFQNFFVSNNYLPSSKLNHIRTLFSNAYIEDISDGLYVSCAAEFNPSNKNLDNAIQYSHEVAKIIGNYRMHR